MMMRGAPIADRFWAYVYRDVPGCWLWRGPRHVYGELNIGSKRVKAHRLSWELAHGPIPDGMDVCHHCDTPLCVNPSHLFLGTHADNMRDRELKGRSRNPQRAKTHCPQGHAYDAANTYRRCGGRQCVTCRQKRDREKSRRKNPTVNAIAA